MGKRFWFAIVGVGGSVASFVMSVVAQAYPQELVSHTSYWWVNVWHFKPYKRLDSQSADLIMRRASAGLCVFWLLWLIIALFWPWLQCLIPNPFRRKSDSQKILKWYGRYKFQRAVWGEGDSCDPEKWRDATENGKPLEAHVRYLLTEAQRGNPVKANNSNLEIDKDFRLGTNKELRLIFPNGWEIRIPDDRYIDITANSSVSKVRINYLTHSRPNSGEAFPQIAGVWKDTGGAITRITQDGDKWTGKCSYRLKDGSVVECEISGTLGSDRKIKGILYHTSCPPQWEVKQNHESQLSADGNKITGIAIWKGGARHFTWNKITTIGPVTPIATVEPPTTAPSSSSSSSASVTPQPTSQISRDNPGRSFEVLCHHLGSWNQGQIITEYDFRKANPALPPHAIGNRVAADDYYEEILQHHINRNPPSIRIVPSND